MAHHFTSCLPILSSHRADATFFASSAWSDPIQKGPPRCCRNLWVMGGGIDFCTFLSHFSILCSLPGFPCTIVLNLISLLSHQLSGLFWNLPSVRGACSPAEQTFVAVDGLLEAVNCNWLVCCITCCLFRTLLSFQFTWICVIQSGSLLTCNLSGLFRHT